MDLEFQELLSINHVGALDFFYSGLREEIGTKKVREDELFHVASILAHFSQTTICLENRNINPMDLSIILDDLIFREEAFNNFNTLQNACAQMMFSVGFWRDGIKYRYNISWCDEIGQKIYYKASKLVKSPKGQSLFDRMADSFPKWAIICNDLNRTFRENRYILKLN